MYSYFPSTDDISYALAEEGFHRLDDKVRSSWRHDDPVEEVRGVGRRRGRVATLVGLGGFAARRMRGRTAAPLRVAEGDDSDEGRRPESHEARSAESSEARSRESYEARSVAS